MPLAMVMNTVADGLPAGLWVYPRLAAGTSMRMDPCSEPALKTDEKGTRREPKKRRSNVTTVCEGGGGQVRVRRAWVQGGGACEEGVGNVL